MLGFHSKSFFITTENHYVGDTFMLASLLFTLARQWLPSFFILESPLHQSIPVATGLNPPELPISDEA